MAPLRCAIISGMNFIFLSLSRPTGRDKLIFTQRPKRIAAIGGTLSVTRELARRFSLRVKLQKLISMKRSYFKLFFRPEWSIMEP